MRFFYKNISRCDALEAVLSFAFARRRNRSKNEVEEIGFDDALNRVLGEDIFSTMDNPPFDRAAMDGYAIRGEDSFGASPKEPVCLRKGEYLPIQTGMPMPKGSNAVVMLEYTKERGEGDRVELEIFKPVTPGKNVSFKGEDVKKGEEVVKEGRLLGANEIGMLAAIGKSRVKVYKKLKIGIISTGDELLDPKLQSLAVLKWEQKQNKVADVNSYVLAGLIQKIAHPWRIGIVKDDYDEIKRVIATSLQECDGLLISGGSSVGERDFLADVVEDLGELMFHGVSIRPGEPTGFAVIENKPVFILPGYPVATISAFELLVRPFLYALHGLREEVGIKIFAVAKRKIPSAVGRSDFVRVKVELIHDNYYVEPVRISGSGILSSMTKSDGFVVVEENKEGVQEGERVEVNMYHLK